MNIQDAIADQQAASKALKSSLGEISKQSQRKRSKTYTEKQHNELIAESVNAALEDACDLIRLKLGIRLGKRKEADQAIAFITELMCK